MQGLGGHTAAMLATLNEGLLGCLIRRDVGEVSARFALPLFVHVGESGANQRLRQYCLEALDYVLPLRLGKNFLLLLA